MRGLVEIIAPGEIVQEEGDFKDDVEITTIRDEIVEVVENSGSSNFTVIVTNLDEAEKQSSEE